MSAHGALPAYIFLCFSVQPLHSSRMCRTVWGPYKQRHPSESALLIECRYARRPIFAIRIYLITKLTALYVPLSVSRISLSGLAPRRKSSLPCLAVA